MIKGSEHIIVHLIWALVARLSRFAHNRKMIFCQFWQELFLWTLTWQYYQNLPTNKYDILLVLKGALFVSTHVKLQFFELFHMSRLVISNIVSHFHKVVQFITLIRYRIFLGNPWTYVREYPRPKVLVLIYLIWHFLWSSFQILNLTFLLS